MQKVHHQRLQKSRLTFLPERVGTLRTLWRGVFYQVVNQAQHVFVILHITKRVIAKRSVRVD